MMKKLEQKALKLHISMLWLRVLDFNARAIGLYEKMGYQQIAVDGKFRIYKKILKQE